MKIEYDFSDVDYIILPAGTILYRAAKTIEKTPTPRKCTDTDKIGTYFSAFNPILAETMRLEYELLHPGYKGNYYVSIYMTTRDIKLSFGKYAFTRNYSRYYPGHWAGLVRPEDNLSHYDNSIYPTSDINENKLEEAEKRGFAEVFLNPYDLNDITYIKSYYLTLEEAQNKWT